MPARGRSVGNSRVYCHPFEAAWPKEAQILEEVPVTLCRRRGPALDLVLDRPRLSRSQFVFTEVKGRPAIFWQTQGAARRANPGARVPRRRVLTEITIAIDTREHYPYRLSGRSISTERMALAAGDYAVTRDGQLLAAVERKTLEDLATSLANGTLSFQMQRLAEIPVAAVVLEANYPDLFRQAAGTGPWLADILSRLQLRYREIPVVFAASRKFAEEWTYRYLVSALADSDDDEPQSGPRDAPLAKPDPSV